MEKNIKEKEQGKYSRDVYMIKSYSTQKFDLNKSPDDQQEEEEIHAKKEVEKAMILDMLKIYLPKLF